MYRNCGCSSDINQDDYENDYDSNNDDYNIYEELNNNYPSYNTVNMCSCGFNQGVSRFPKNVMYGHSYVPNQVLNKLFTPEIGLKMGTIYPELVSPYSPGQSMEVINFLKKCNDVGEGCNSNG